MALDTAKHKNILIQVLKDIFNDDSLAPVLGFKGGTEALLFYNLERFSVDLDFDLLDESKSEHVFERIKIILKQYGTIKEDRIKRYSIFFLLSYDSTFKDAQNIKVEINKRSFGSRYELKHYLGIPMRVMVQEDMVANKLVAMYERIGTTNRDIYDVWFFFHNHFPINTAIIERRTNMQYIPFLHKCIEALENVNDRTILSGIGELLTAKQKAWVKAKLKTETIFLLKLAIQQATNNG